MNAEEMFNELGYKAQEPFLTNIKFYENCYDDVLIFFKSNRTVTFETRNNTPSIKLDSNVIKAVNKQLEELGW